MAALTDASLLPVLLDSWDRNNTILTNLLRLVPPHALEASATAGGPTVAQLFSHMHFVRLAFVCEDVSELAVSVPSEEWVTELDRDRLEQLLNASAASVREAVTNRITSGRPMDLHYDHPVLFLQHMIWHEGYHHGQIKLALKLAGQPISDDDAGPLTWGIWMDKS